MRQRFFVALRVWFGVILLILEVWAWNLVLSPPYNLATPISNNLAIITVGATFMSVCMYLAILGMDLLTGCPHDTWIGEKLHDSWDNFLEWLDKHD